MKNVMKYFAIIVIASLMSSCSNEVLEQKEDGLFYAVDSETPYTGEHIVAYSSGEDSIVANVVNGTYDGSCVVFYPNGIVSDSITYIMGEIDKRVGFTKNGQAICSCEEITYDTEKEVYMTVNEPIKIYTGTCRKYWDNGNIKQEESYKNGRDYGIRYFWYENGQMSFRDTQKDGKHVKEEQWYEDGQQKYLRENDKDGKISILKKWFPDGQKNWEIYYNNCDKYLADSVFSWYEDGTIAINVVSQKDEPIKYHPFDLEDVSGNMKTNFRYWKNAKGKTFYKNGKVEFEFFYKGVKQFKNPGNYYGNKTLNLCFIYWGVKIGWNDELGVEVGPYERISNAEIEVVIPDFYNKVKTIEDFSNYYGIKLVK